MQIQKSYLLLAILLFSIVGCNPKTKQAEQNPSLKKIFKDDFKVGAAINSQQLYGNEPEAVKLIKEQFNAISPENVLKWEPVNPRPDSFDFESSDRYVAFGKANKMFILGHNLIWHKQIPSWVFHNNDGSLADAKQLKQRMRNHIFKVAGRYQGRIDAWDVVNEAVNADGSLRQTNWLKIMGKEYLPLAFQYADSAAPDAELYYNDFDLYKPAKRQGVVRLIKNLQDQGVRVDGIGMQGHWGLNVPDLQQVQKSIDAFSDLGVKIMISELDITVLPRTKDMNAANLATGYSMVHGLDPYKNGLPDSIQTRLANRYAAIFKLFHKNRDKISRVTFWGVNNKDSWLNNWPKSGRTDYPLLFDRNNQPKAAFDSVVKVVE